MATPWPWGRGGAEAEAGSACLSSVEEDASEVSSFFTTAATVNFPATSHGRERYVLSLAFWISLWRLLLHACRPGTFYLT